MHMIPVSQLDAELQIEKENIYANIKWTYNKNKIYKLDNACYRDSGRNNFIVLWKIVRIKEYMGKI